MFTYAYRCTHLDWKYEKEKKKSITRQRFALALCTFEALYLTKVLKRKKCVQCFQILLNCRPLLTGSNLYLGCDDIHRSVHFKMWGKVTVYRTQLLSRAAL